jgi:hypothetical protein
MATSGCNAEDSLDGQPGSGMKQVCYMARTANFDITNIYAKLEIYCQSLQEINSLELSKSITAGSIMMVKT